MSEEPLNSAHAQVTRAQRAPHWLLFAAVGFQLGCNGTRPGANSAAGAIARDTKVIHQACDTGSSGAEKIDANGDGKVDITIVRDNGREQCRAVDLNFDGVIDAYTYFDGSGQVVRRENDYDKDGSIDEVSTFKAGQITEKDQSTSLAKRLDTWDFYQAGALVRTERDSNGDGVIDQWWEYPKAGCPLIHADVNNDGRPDPGATIDYCKETGYVPPDRSDRAPASPTFDSKTTIPTETENKIPTETSAPATDKATQSAPAPAPASTKGSSK